MLVAASLRRCYTSLRVQRRHLSSQRDVVESIMDQSGLTVKDSTRQSLAAIDPSKYVATAQEMLAKVNHQPRDIFLSLEDDLRSIALMDEVLEPQNHVLDLGCEYGYSTSVLALAMFGGRPTDTNTGRLAGVDRVPSKIDATFQTVAATLSAAELARDTGVLNRITLALSDGLVEGQPGAPFHGIRLGCLLPDIHGEDSKLIQTQLRRGGVLVAPAVCRETGKNMLYKVSKPAEKGGASHVEAVFELVGQPNPIVPGVMVEEEMDEQAREAYLKKKQEKEQVQEALLRWRQDFEEKHGRRPNRSEMMTDAVAKDLFSRFAALNSDAN